MMTDNEIIKALECCTKPYCNNNKCPLHKNTVNTKDCITQLSTLALDLINRQKAEIERLKGYNENLLTANTALSNEVFEAKAEAVKKFAERLKKEKFTERFCGQKYDLIHGWINDLAKEMIGDET